MSTLVEAAAVISEAEKNLVDPCAPLSHAQAVEIAELLDSQRRELAHLRTSFARDQAELASMRITVAEAKADLEQAVKVTEELVDGLSEETRKRQVAEVALASVASRQREADIKTRTAYTRFCREGWTDESLDAEIRGTPLVGLDG